MCVMTVSIQVDASYRTMENGRLRKESRVFSKSKAFLSTSAHSPPTPVSLDRLLPWVSLSRFHNHHPNVKLRLYDGNVLESLVYGLSWLQIVCKMFCREKVSGAGLFSPWDVEEMLSDCWYLFWKTFRHGRVRLLHLIPVPNYISKLHNYDEKRNKALVWLNWILVLWKHKKWSASWPFKVSRTENLVETSSRCIIFTRRLFGGFTLHILDILSNMRIKCARIPRVWLLCFICVECDRRARTLR